MPKYNAEILSLALAETVPKFFATFNFLLIIETGAGPVQTSNKPL
jgi:hypothetical protein